MEIFAISSSLYQRQSRRLLLAFILSIFFHLLLFISLELRPDFSWFHYIQKKTPSQKVARFDFVFLDRPLVIETPEVEKEEVPSELTNIISDKNIVAKDNLKKEEINSKPYSEGKTEKIKDIVKSIPSVKKELSPQPKIEKSQAPPVKEEIEDKGIDILAREEVLQEGIPEQEEIPPQKEQIASIPKNLLRIPLYDDRLSNARGFGEITFNVKKHEVAPYIIKMKKKIEEHWAPPVIFTYYGLTSGETVVQFKIMPDGSVNDLKVIREKGDESLKKSSLQAIMDASPFDPLPPQILTDEKYLSITFTFYYIIDEPGDNI